MIDLNRVGGGKQYAHKILGINVNINPIQSKEEQTKLLKKLKETFRLKQRPTKD